LLETATEKEVSVDITDLAYILGQLHEVRENNRLLQQALVDLKCSMSTHDSAVVDQLIDRFGVKGRKQYI